MFLIQDRVKNCPLFGVITGGSDVVDVLSRTPPLERGAFDVSMQFLQRDDWFDWSFCFPFIEQFYVYV